MKFIICILAFSLCSLFVNAQVSRRTKRHKTVSELKTITPQLAITDSVCISLPVLKPEICCETICICDPVGCTVMVFGDDMNPFTAEELSEMGAKGISGPHVVPIRHGQPH